MDIYAEEIISNYEHPHNRGKISNPTAKMHENNPTCGDDLTIYISIEDNKIKDIKFDGTGCAISIASASMLTDIVSKKSVDEVEKMGVNDIIEMLGIDPGPARLKCATLSLRTLKGAIFIYKNKKPDKSIEDL